ncbi:MAG TPA: hypothetical protein VG101_03445 [Puia sp.]|jgi:hypothetical protein|nr:hypothetical protein [Puia sp.]
MLAYMAVVLGYDHSDSNFVHNSVYKIAKDQLSPETYDQLTDGGLEFRKRMAENSSEFYQQMPFYSVKPLYTRLIYFMYKAGVPLIPATLVPSFIGYILIAFLLIIWIKKYLQLIFAFAVSLLIMLSAPTWDIARSSTPDSLSAFLLLGALYFMIERRSLFLTFSVLLLSIFARIDNVIPSIFIVSFLAFSNKWKDKISIQKYLVMLMFILLSYLSITLGTRKYGWDILYYPTFSKSLNLNYAYHAEFHFQNYLALSTSHIMTGLFYTYLPLFMALALMVFVSRTPFNFRNLNFDQLLVGIIILIILVRFLLHPVIADRLYIAYYLCILILLIRKLYGPLSPHKDY